MKKRIVLSILVLIISVVCFEALVFTPQKKITKVNNYDDIICELGMKESTITEYELNEYGGYSVGGDQFGVEFLVKDYQGKYMAVRLSNPVTYRSLFQIYYCRTGADGYYEGDTINVTVPVGDRYTYFLIPEDCESLVFRSPSPFSFEASEIHENPPTTIIESYSVNWLYAVMMFILSLAIAGIMWFIDGKINVSDRCWEFVKTHYKKIPKILLFIAIDAIVSAVGTLILSNRAYYPTVLGKGFNVFTFIFILSILFCGEYLYFCRNIMKENFEAVVFGFILIVGTCMIFVSPCAHTGWDVDTHYIMSLKDSYLGEVWYTQADIDIATARYDFLAKGSYVDNTVYAEHMNIIYDYAVDSDNGSFSLPHLPGAIGMAIGRNLRLSFVGVYRLGELFNLLVYAILVYFAMRRLKAGKTILAVIALFPTNIFMAGNYQYDTWVIGFSLLGMAYFIREFQEEEGTIEIKNAIIMGMSFMLACLPKQIYIPLLLLPFLVPLKRIKNKILHYSMCCAYIILLGISLLARTVEQTTGTGDLRGGSSINPSAQIQYIIDGTKNYLKLLFKFLTDYISITKSGNYISNFGNLGYCGVGVTVFTVLLVIVVLTDHNEEESNNIKIWHRAYGIAMYVGVAALIATAFYIVYTPVGADYFAGCQGRYLTPMLYPMCALLGGGKIVNDYDKKKTNMIILSLISATMYVIIFQMMLRKMM